MKHCRKCGVFKDTAEFNKNSLKKDGLQSQCRQCSKDNNNRGYIKNPNRSRSIKLRNAEIRSSNKKFISRYKRICGCKVCGEKEPVVLDLHHRDPSKKEHNPASMLSHSRNKLKEEVRKCTVLCSNCHRKYHAGLIEF